MNVIVYTALMRAYDQLRRPKFADIPHVLYTDQHREYEGWERCILSKEFHDPRRESRRQKIRPHAYLPKPEFSIYHDANIQLCMHPHDMICDLLGDADLAVFSHPHRDCVYAEADICEKWKLDAPAVLKGQVNSYAAAGMPYHAGLYACGLIIRRMNANTTQFNEMWWHEFVNGSLRDQLSFAYSVWRYPINIRIIEGDIFNSPIVRVVKHVMGRG